MTIKVDHRTLPFERDDAALAELETRHAAWLEQEIGLARLFSRIECKRAFRAAGCESVTELGARRGYDRRRVGELCRLGHALAAEPRLAGMLRDGEVSFEAACQLGRIHRDPGLVQPDDRWTEWARTERIADLKRRIRKRIETVRQGEVADIPFLAQIPARVAANLARCRELAARKVGYHLTNGQLIDVLSTGYLLDHDIMTAALGSHARRMPPTASRPGERGIAAKVLRALEERSGGVCEFGTCDRPAQEICHIVPHAQGSAREVEDLVHGCHGHHTQYDGGLLEFLGWTRSEDSSGEGLPVFRVVETKEMLLPKPRPGLASDEAPPEWMLQALGRRLRRRLGGSTDHPSIAARRPRRGRDPDR